MERSSSRPLALICAVPLEMEPLRRLVREPARVCIGRKPGVAGFLDGVSVLLLPAGMGKTNAAQVVTALLETSEVRGVIGFGVAGAYPESSLQPGDVAIATSEIYGDEGTEAPDGWLGTKEIGIPLLERGDTRRFNEFPLPREPIEAALRALEAAGVRTASGPFVTVSCCSGTTIRGARLAGRFGAICESMEGAALAHVCELYGTPFLELRAISNTVEDRDLSRWKLKEAAEAAARAVRIVVRSAGLKIQS